MHKSVTKTTKVVYLPKMVTCIKDDLRGVFEK